MSSDYAGLKAQVTAAGLLAAQPAYYAAKSAVALAMVTACVAVAVLVRQPVILLLDALMLGIATTQIALLAHDVGHRQAFRSRPGNRIASLFFGDLLLGVSCSWWTTKHNQHHATPNHLDDDPDIRFPILVFAREQIAAKRRWLRPLIAIQAYVFVLLLPFQAVNMRLSSVSYVLGQRPRGWLAESIGLAVHFALYAVLAIQIGSWPLAVAFVAVHQVSFGLYNSSVFASNHKGMPVITADGRMDFLREQVLTSRNLDGHRFTDFWYGGLNYQIEHHLFPTMPRNRLAEAQTIVRKFCAEQGVSYYTTGLLNSYRETFSHLHKVSAELRGARRPTMA